MLLFTKRGVGGTENVWFYDVASDGSSLDDKRADLLPLEKQGPTPAQPLRSAAMVAAGSCKGQVSRGATPLSAMSGWAAIPGSTAIPPSPRIRARPSLTDARQAATANGTETTSLIGDIRQRERPKAPIC